MILGIANILTHSTEVINIEVKQRDLEALATLAERGDLKGVVEDIFEISDYQRALSFSGNWDASSIGKHVIL